MKHPLLSLALPVCALAAAAQHAWAAAQVQRGTGFDGAFPGAPVS